MNKIIDYEKDVEIDEDALDQECLDQASLMMKYCKHSAKCERERDEAKESLGLIKAELDQKIRLNPEKFKIEKITETAISSTIIQQISYQKANEDYLNKCFESNVAFGAVKSVDQRKKMLELLVQLHGQQYFAGPRVPHNLHEEREARREQINIKSNAAMRRK
jgi:hypothetical protein